MEASPKKYERGDILIGTKYASEKYNKTIKDSIILFLSYYDDRHPDGFTGKLIGHKQDPDIRHKIAKEKNKLIALDKKPNSMDWVINSFSLSIGSERIILFEPFNYSTTQSKVLHRKRLPNL